MSRAEAPLPGIHTRDSGSISKVRQNRRELLRGLTMGVVALSADLSTGGRITKALISAFTPPQVSAASGPKGSERASTPLATPNPERKIANGEALTSSNPLKFTYPDSNGQPVRRSWEMDNARFGISPNNPDRIVGTIDDFNENTGQIINYIQPNTALYPETNLGRGISVVIAGQIVDISTGIAYLATEISGNMIYPKLEIIPDINKPNDYAARKVYNNGLPTGGSEGDSSWGFKLASDSQGKYLELEIKYSKNPKDDGRYRVRLDNAGNPVGDWSRSPVQNNRSYLPITNS